MSKCKSVKSAQIQNDYFTITNKLRITDKLNRLRQNENCGQTNKLTKWLIRQNGPKDI